MYVFFSFRLTALHFSVSPLDPDFILNIFAAAFLTLISFALDVMHLMTIQ